MKKVINFLKRFKWEEARDVELHVLINLATTVLCYPFALVAVLGFIIKGAWWALIPGAMFYILGAVCLNDTQYTKESALQYLKRVFAK